MKNFYILGIIVVAGLLLLGVSRSPDNKIQERKKTSVIEETAVLETKTNSEGDVIITVTPKNLTPDSWDFEISLSTHSVELSEDLTEVSVLVDENGNEYKPVSWEGDPPGGHHRSGALRFGNLTPAPQAIILMIRQVGGIAERKFEWALLEN